MPKKLFNRVKLGTSYFLGLPKALGMPVEAFIEITTRCNLACIMCPSGVINRPKKDMSWSLYKKIIDEIAPFVELIYVHGLGEPLLHPQIFEFIQYAKGKRIRVGFSTNAMLLNKAKSQRLLDSGVDYVILAIDGATKETYEKIKVGGDFERVEKNIKNFLQMKKRRKKAPFTVVQFIKMAENEKEADQFLARWQGKGADVVRVKPVVDVLHQRKPKETILSQPCLYPYRMISIYFDGTVVPCCEDNFGEYALGNIKEKPLSRIWNDQKAQVLRRELAGKTRKEIAICQRCLFPQPSIPAILAVTILDDLTVKKILPFLERIPILNRNLIIYD